MDPFLIRNIVYGIEDSLISTTGVVVGTHFAKVPNKYIIVSGLILVFVEALSMAYGAFVSDESFLIFEKKQYTNKQLLIYGFTMFFSYLFTGLIILLPYFWNLQKPYIYSILIVIIGLFLLFLKTNKSLKKNILLTTIGYLILIISIKIGTFLKYIETL